MNITLENDKINIFYANYPSSIEQIYFFIILNI